MTTEIPAYLSDTSPEIKATDAALARGAALAKELVDIDNTITQLETTLDNAKKFRDELAHKTIPDFFTETLHTDCIGLPDSDADVVITPYYKASIPASWPPHQREAAFSHLTELGHGDIITHTITITFPRSHQKDAQQFLDSLRTSAIANIATIATAKSVPWATLTAVVKEQITSGHGDLIDLPTLGATVGRVAKIKKRRT